jgi:UDP-N-acetylmuramyl pentapeptide phosphotransferase/UDP-N-acetylglucosamine-1-phosphate transferase
MEWLVVGGIILLGGGGTFIFVALMGVVVQEATSVASCLLYLIGAGTLFAAGFLTARHAFDMAERPSLLIGAAVPLAYAVGRLTWVKLGLPTPWSDYERWRDQDHRNYWWG